MGLIRVWWCDHHDHIYISGTEGCDATRLTCVNGVTERFRCNNCSVRGDFTSNAAPTPPTDSGADSTTRLREALARAICDSDDGPHSFDTEHPLDQEQYLINADAILASLVEHRDDVLDELGMTEVGWVSSLGDDGTFYPIAGEGEKWRRFDGDTTVYAFRPKEQP